MPESLKGKGDVTDAHFWDFPFPSGRKWWDGQVMHVKMMYQFNLCDV